MMNPYPGLRPFDAEYEEWFFGRDRQIAELVDRLRSHRFVAVVGLSGSGKSSLVRAGLLPALSAGQLGPPGSGWRIAVVRPSEEPVATLAAELNKDGILGPSAGRAALLESSSFGLIETAREGSPPGTNLMVVVDQFEDLFRLVDGGKLDPLRAAHFINLLLTVAEEPRTDFPVYAVITLRSEYLGHCARFYGLPETLNRSQYLVPRLTPEQLREAIESPAALTAVKMEPALVQRLLVEAATAPDELPRLQHLLMRLWEYRKRSQGGDRITLEEYRHKEIKELERALDLHAEAVYNGLPEEQKRIAKRIFQRLTTWDATSRDARRPTGLKELAAVSSASPEAVMSVVEQFRAAHFLTEIPAAVGGESMLDITHESLLRHWKRLEGWAKKEARAADIFRSLANENRPLWSEVEVLEAIKWRDRFRPNDPWADRYRAGRLPAAVDVLKQFEKELSAPRRRRQFIAGLIGVVVVLASLFGWALRERSRADGLRLACLKRGLAAESVALLRVNGDSYIPATLLAVESMKRGPLLENHAALRDATSLTKGQVSALVHASLVYAVAFSPDGKWVATASADKTARVMEAATGKEVSRLTHQEAVFGVAFSPDGKWLATGSYDNTARLMDAATGKEVWRITHGGPVSAVAFSRDGKWVATGSWDNSARVMEASTGKLVARLGHDYPVNAVAFSPDGKRVATASNDSTARMMDAATGGEVWRLNHEGPVIAVAFSPDNKWVATGSNDNTARVIDALKGKEKTRVTHQGAVNAVTFSPDSGSLATGSQDNSARVIDGTTGKDGVRLDHQGPVLAISFSPDGKRLATGSGDNTARVMEVATGTQVARLAHQGRVSAVAFSRDGKRVATGSHDRTARVMEAAMAKEVASITHESRVTTIDFSRDGKLVATGSDDKTARVTDSRTGEVVASLAHKGPVTWVVFSHDGKLVATGSKDKMAWVMEVATGKELARVAHQDTVQAVAFSPDGKRVATGSEDKFARVFEVATGKQVASLAHQGTVTWVAFSPDGRLVATASEDKSAGVMEAATGREVARLVHQGPVTAVVFSPDSKWVATASKDNTARVMDASSGKEVARLTHQGPVLAIAFSPDGMRLATGSEDNAARILDLATRTEVPPLAHQGPVTWVAFSQDKKKLATGSGDNIARVMDAETGTELVRHRMTGPALFVSIIETSTLLVAAFPSENEVELSRIELDPVKLIDDACSRLPRNLTREEWDRYLPGEPYRATCSNLPEEPTAK